MFAKSVNKKRVKLFLLVLLLAGSVFLLATSALAQETTNDNTDQKHVGPLGYKLQVPIGSMTSVDDLGDYIRNFYNYFMLAAAVLATFMIMFGGYLWLTALGNSERISRAKEFIFSAVTGLFLALLSYVILYTINPSIVELKPLNVAFVKLPEFGGPMANLCPWGELDPQKKIPVECETVIPLPPTSEDETPGACTGILSGDGDDICQITEDRRGSKMGMVMSSLFVYEDIADVSNQGGRTCGVLWYNANRGRLDPGWTIGSGCSKIPYGDAGGRNDRCIMIGESPEISYDKGTTDCNINKAMGEWCESEDMRRPGGCGCITNMYCYAGVGVAGGSTCNGLSEAGTCTMGNTSFSCDQGVQSQIDKNLVSDPTKWIYPGIHDALVNVYKVGEAAARVSSFSDNSLGRCATNWMAPQCSGNQDSCDGSCCAHRGDSDHYCDTSKKSRAIDFGDENYAQEICKAAIYVLSDGGYIKKEGTHIHLGFGKGTCKNPDPYILSKYINDDGKGNNCTTFK